ncbi:MAG: Imm8 family immunity protein [Polyangiales bacterium]
MLKLKIRGVGSASFPSSQSSAPATTDHFSSVVLVDIGTKHKSQSETFTLRVATPSGLAAMEDLNGVIAGSPLLVLRRFDVDVLTAWLERTVASCAALSWNECVDNLRMHFDHEFSFLDDAPPPGKTHSVLIGLDVKRIAGADGRNLHRIDGEEAELFGQRVIVDISTRDGVVSERFSTYVATPEALTTRSDDRGVIACRPVVVVRRFAFDELRCWLEETASSCRAATWSECVQRLNRHFDREP